MNGKEHADRMISLLQGGIQNGMDPQLARQVFGVFVNVLVLAQGEQSQVPSIQPARNALD